MIPKEALSAWWAKSWPVLATTALLGLAFPPVGLGLLVFVALVPWLQALRQASPREARRLGGALGYLFFAFQMFWLVPFLTKWTGSAGLATIPWLVTVLLQVPYFMLLGWAINGAFRMGRPWMIPLIWAGLEAVRAFIPVAAFPHAFLATPLWRATPLISLSALGTVFLVSAWVCLLNVTIVEVMARQKSAIRLIQASVIGMLLSAGVFFEVRQRPVDRVVQVTVGQVGVDMAFSAPSDRERELRASIQRLSEEAVAQGSDLLVLPESMFGGGETLPPRWPYPAPALPMIVGGQRGDGPVYQSVYGYDGNWTVADKTRLVIFGEFVPFREQLSRLEGFRLPTADLVPGTEVRTLRVNEANWGSIVCFEGMFPDIALRQASMGAQALAIVSIDDWFIDTPMMDQLLAASAFRAAETGLPVVRSSSLGWTAAFDRTGALVTRAPLRERVALRTFVQLGIPERRPPFPLLFPILAALGLLVHVGLTARHNRGN